MLDLIRNLRFALSESPLSLHAKELERMVEESDAHRAGGVASSLTRGSVLIQQEKIFTRELSR